MTVLWQIGNRTYRSHMRPYRFGILVWPWDLRGLVGVRGAALKGWQRRARKMFFPGARPDLTKLSATHRVPARLAPLSPLNTSKSQGTCGKRKVLCRHAFLYRRASLEISRKASGIKLLSRGDFSRRFAGTETKNGQNEISFHVVSFFVLSQYSADIFGGHNRCRAIAGNVNFPLVFIA
ncbi:hypothetical protein JQV19_10260 [Sulfitobacter mediterraneus]|uniref:hypothetical protein n=1 Tax=Sulfitobacter mediterraneus TaxID=83219 RepID=UPI00193964BC|nr:hypothetical protein [Sulfitobacter mediterraneus]MBM1557031.1 hypothetical protein [Sulfitobacter mediterraneus]MBM1569216.1 hypothetical protein [Sulfitobacter mediterraneus]MBM1572643.1 hypothetical protein [Sulfitobacter mediterraneus]MBM1576806.1 hypothetical protein [Sulfitobacter mediterraneus]MBM1579989.1 hypothetical protein [Sulfitobacter mediterraneus]